MSHQVLLKAESSKKCLYLANQEEKAEGLARAADMMTKTKLILVKALRSGTKTPIITLVLPIVNPRQANCTIL